MSVTQQLITQANLWHVVDVMDQEETVRYQSQNIEGDSWMTRAILRSKHLGNNALEFPVPLVADCRRPQVALGPKPPEEDTMGNELLHKAVYTRRMARDRFPDLNHPNLDSEDLWESLVQEAIDSAARLTYTTKRAAFSLDFDNSKQAALTEIDYMTLCFQEHVRPQMSYGDLTEFLCRFFSEDGTQDSRRGPDSAAFSSPPDGAAMPTLPNPGPQYQPDDAMGDLSQYNSSSVGTGQFSEDMTRDLTGLASAPHSNSSGQASSPGRCSLFSSSSEHSPGLSDTAANTAPTVANRDSFDHNLPFNQLQMPFQNGQMQATHSPLQQYVTASGQPYSAADVPPVDDSGPRATIAEAIGPPPQPGVPAQPQPDEIYYAPGIPLADKSGLQAQPVANVYGSTLQSGATAEPYTEKFYPYADDFPINDFSPPAQSATNVGGPPPFELPARQQYNQDCSIPAGVPLAGVYGPPQPEVPAQSQYGYITAPLGFPNSVPWWSK